MNVVCILLDSLNRHFLSAYGASPAGSAARRAGGASSQGVSVGALSFAETPNLERLARHATTFDNAFVGSMPCMPARRDLWTGVQEFLWRPWGSLEPWDEPLPRTLKSAGVFTGLVSDHYHLWEAGGENYHVDFESWEFIRGHENDPWIGGRMPEADAGKGQVSARFRRNRQRFVHEEDWLAPRTLREAARWLEENGRAHERFFLMVDEFDPHEPFDGPEELWRRYDPDWKGPRDFYWPIYGRNDYSEAEVRHIRARYAAKVTLADRYLGRVLDKMDDMKLWDDTALIVMTDHGHFLGEHGWWGKPGCPQYRAISHAPLFLRVPGAGGGGRSSAIASHVDVHATILDLFGVKPPVQIDGESLLPVLRGERGTARPDHIFGWWGRRVNWTDGRLLYMRAPARPDNQPLYFYTDRWSTAPWWRLPRPDSRAEFGRFIPRAGMPVGRQRMSGEEMSAIHGISFDDLRDGSLLFDMQADPAEQKNLSGTPLEREAAARLKARLELQQAPPDQLERLGL